MAAKVRKRSRRVLMPLCGSLQYELEAGDLAPEGAATRYGIALGILDMFPDAVELQLDPPIESPVHAKRQSPIAARQDVRGARSSGRRANFDAAGQPDAAKRRGRDPRRDGLVTALNFLRAGIAAIMPENAGGVGQPVLEVASVNHAADVSPRIDVVCPEGAIHEVVVR